MKAPVVLDAEGLSTLAEVRPPNRLRLILEEAHRQHREVLLPAVVCAEACRGIERTRAVEAAISRAGRPHGRAPVVIIDTDFDLARQVGAILHATGSGTGDIVDAHVVADGPTLSYANVLSPTTQWWEDGLVPITIAGSVNCRGSCRDPGGRVNAISLGSGPSGLPPRRVCGGPGVRYGRAGQTRIVRPDCRTPRGHAPRSRRAVVVDIPVGRCDGWAMCAVVDATCRVLVAFVFAGARPHDRRRVLLRRRCLRLRPASWVATVPELPLRLVPAVVPSAPAAACGRELRLRRRLRTCSAHKSCSRAARG